VTDSLGLFRGRGLDDGCRIRRAARSGIRPLRLMGAVYPVGPFDGQSGRLGVAAVDRVVAGVVVAALGSGPTVRSRGRADEESGLMCVW